MEKVLWMYCELRAEEGRGEGKINVGHRVNSFSSARTMVGMRIGHGWRVNGKLYVEGRSNYHDGDNLANDAKELVMDKPAFKDLYPWQGSVDVVLPFDQKMWDTLVGVETTLIKAAALLMGLTKQETAIPLLQSGTLLLK
jgi:hypothetical protein